MNMNRNRPPKGPDADLDVWFSGLINDGIRDALEAGMPRSRVLMMLRSYLRTQENAYMMKAGDSWSHGRNVGDGIREALAALPGGKAI